MAYVAQASQQRRGGLNNIIHDGTSDFGPFILALTQDLEGQLKQITVVDRYIYRSQHIKKLTAFAMACRELEDKVNLRVLTSEFEYLKMSTNYSEEDARKKYIDKLSPNCDELLLMEATKGVKPPHDRYIIIESNTETRFFGGTNTLFQGDGEKRFTIIDRVLEPELFTHLKMTNEVEEKA